MAQSHVNRGKQRVTIAIQFARPDSKEKIVTAKTVLLVILGIVIFLTAGLVLKRQKEDAAPNGRTFSVLQGNVGGASTRLESYLIAVGVFTCAFF
jgi:hypothetical protein